MSNEITEVSLDDLNSNVSNVSVERIENTVEESASIVPPLTPAADEGVEDLDLLADPNKSRQNSPKPTNTSNIETKTAFTESVLDNSAKTQVSKLDETPSLFEPVTKTNPSPSLDFSINVVPPKETKPVLPFISKPKNQERVMENGVEKQELLFRLKRLESRGIPLSKHYSSSSSLQDMKDEYSRLKHQRDLENSIKFQRKTMMAFASGVEFLNSKFDPFDIKLDGWSESLHENLADYDDVFEELHEKYKTKAKVAPELKLLMMLGGSAVMFHMTNSFFKSSMPDMDDILKQNPDLARQFANAAVNSSTQNNPGLGHVLGDMLNQSNPQPSFVPPVPSFVPEAAPPPNMETSIPEMSGPKDQDVERILNQIQEMRTQPNSDSPKQATREVVVQSLEKKKRGRPKKSQSNSFPLNI